MTAWRDGRGRRGGGGEALERRGGVGWIGLKEEYTQFGPVA